MYILVVLIPAALFLALLGLGTLPLVGRFEVIRRHGGGGEPDIV